MKFTIQTISNNIDFTDYSDLYPGCFDKDIIGLTEYHSFRFESKEEFEEYAKDIIDLFDNFPNEFPVYRSIKVKSNEDINMNDLGESWSFDLQSAKEFGRHNGSNVILSAIVTNNNVNWYESLLRYLNFSVGDDSDDENEIVINDTEQLKNITINKMKESIEIDKNPIFTREPYVKSFENWSNESFTKHDDILPKEILKQIQKKLNFKQFKRLDSGRYGTAFKISSSKVLKITKDLKEYEYAKKIEGLKNTHIADVYKTYHFTYDDTKYAIIIKEFCRMNVDWMDKLIDSFVKYTGDKMSLSYISSEFLSENITKTIFDNYFKTYNKNQGNYNSDDWYDMIMELKEKKIYVKDFNGSNVGMKLKSNHICIIELGLGYWENIKFNPDDNINLNENLNNHKNIIDKNFVYDKSKLLLLIKNARKWNEKDFIEEYVYLNDIDIIPDNFGEIHHRIKKGDEIVLHRKIRNKKGETVRNKQGLPMYSLPYKTVITDKDYGDKVWQFIMNNTQELQQEAKNIYDKNKNIQKPPLKKGKTIIGYHTSPNKFEVFKLIEDSTSGQLGANLGFFFFKNIKNAKYYASVLKENYGKSYIYECEIRLGRVCIFKGEDIGTNWGRFGLLEQSRIEGYSTVIVEDADTGYGIADEIVVFDDDNINIKHICEY